MTFRDILASDLNAVFFNTDEFADTVAYTPAAGGQARSIKALLEYGDPDESGLPGMDALHTEATMEIMADATNGIAQVAANDVVAIGTDTWRVLYAAKTHDGLIWRCRISRSTR